MSEAGPEALDPAAVRSIALLSAAAFVSMATMRVADPLLPLVAVEFGVPPSGAAVIATSAAFAYAICQFFWGSIGDRFGKYTVIAGTTLFSALGTAAAAFADSLAVLGALRFVAAATSAAIIPLAIAHVGDIVPYRQRQTVLARFLSGQILGIVFGQAAGGLFAEHFGWRGIFLVLGLLYLTVDGLLWIQLARGRSLQVKSARLGLAALVRQYVSVLRRGRVRLLLAIVSIEGLLFFGAFTFLGAFAHHELDLGFTALGIVLAGFGLGGLGYSLTVATLVARLGERGMALVGGALMALCFLGFAAAQAWWALAPAVMLAGYGFYMHHNTLQTNGSQMAPEARGLAMSVFASSFYLGQAFGVELCGWAIDRIGYRAVFVAIAVGVMLLAVVFARALPGRAAKA